MLADEVLNCLAADDYLSRGREALVRFKDRGGSQREAVEAIRHLLEQAGDDDERLSRLMELGDFACGWCQPKYKVWESALT